MSNAKNISIRDNLFLFNSNCWGCRTENEGEVWKLMENEVLGRDSFDIAGFSDVLGGDFVEMSYKLLVLMKLYDISTGTIHFYRRKVI